ncbi:CYFA0S17e01640g1_1 [Cyberlindnera fabianii]|uniref:CYFA0S17e01640g1_1 n=1 Tax=Cyberlindnera fabianii TaxID=36022 RepID=A0A061B7G0_CYBFA|nr:CYFA0S17e01640g1_1 [Cyberlindnera fabianii]
MSETPQPSSPITETPSRASPTPGPASTSKSKKSAGGSSSNGKTAADVLERRRLGRIKAAETMALKIKKVGIERRDNPLKYSVFENVNIINQKNYFTDYLKKDEQSYILRERKEARLGKTPSKSGSRAPGSTPALADDDEEMNDDDEDNDDENADEEDTDEDRAGRRTIVIHPGSRNIRIGLGTDLNPKTIPFVMAVPGTPHPSRESEHSNTEQEEQKYETYKKLLVRDFKERMKYYKRRIIPNSNEIAMNFNKKSLPEEIPEHNDVHRVEFIKPSSPPDPMSYYVGDDALRLDSKEYRLRYPLITNGQFNEEAYASLQENIGEIQLFLVEVLKKEFDISQLKNFRVVLVIPDLYDKIYVQTFIELLLQMQFQGVAIMQEALAATYGAGVSCATVIDIGANTTKVSCVDDGMVLPNSRGVVQFGGDDVTRFFYKLLQESNFPMTLDENIPHEWVMLEQLKEKFITFQDANVTVQLYSFIKRYTDKLSEKYEFKVFDEVILAPMALFFPQVFKKPDHILQKKPFTKSKSTDIFTGEADNPTSTTQKNIEEGLYADMADFDILKDLLNSQSQEDGTTADVPAIAPLDKLIIQSIANASRYDYSKAKQFYSNLLIVGGSSKIESLDFILTDRINIWRPRILALLNFPDFIKTAEGIISQFQKDNEMSKIQSEEELAPLQEKLNGQIEKELESFLDSITTGQSIPVEVLPSPRDIDPTSLTWKGASVFSRLKLVEEFMISHRDWDLMGYRTLQYKALWNY